MEQGHETSVHAPAIRDGSAREALMRHLRRDLDALTLHQDRRPGAAGHAAACAYLVQRLGELALPSYTGDGYVVPFGSGLANVLASIHGGDRHLRPVVVATNYDSSRDAPGASENAASMAVMLALAERLHAPRLDRGVVLAFFDDAAPPRHRDSATGATVLLNEQRRHDVKAAIVLDRLGHRGDDDARNGSVFVTGAETDAKMPNVLEDISGESFRLVPVHRRSRKDVATSAPFVAAGVPYLELCGGHWSGHGTERDTADRIDLAMLVDLVDVVEALVRRLDRVRLPGPYEGYDSSVFEAQAQARARLADELVP
jgi:hypothetical protein